MVKELTTIDKARAELFDQFQRDDGGLFWTERFPWVVSYSGGKDSTLVLLLVVEALKKFGSLRPVYVLFSDTRIDPIGSVERVKRNFTGLKRLAKQNDWNLKTAIVRPAPKERFFNMIIGRGYSPPYPPRMRWCVDRLKLKPIRAWKRKTFAGAPFFMTTGERLDESAHRKDSMTKRNPNNARVFKGTQAIRNERTYTPIRNVDGVELWEYLGTFQTFPWGEPLEELCAQYEAKSPAEIIAQNKERRSGCRFCTFCRKEKTGADPLENAFCSWLVEYSTQDVEKRHLIDSSKLTRYNAEKYADSRRAILEKGLAVGISPPRYRLPILSRVLELETKTGQTLLSKRDLKYIIDEINADYERIDAGELVDARVAFKVP